MRGETRTTVYLKPPVYGALRFKSATTDRSLSDIINAASLDALREDAMKMKGSCTF